MVFEPWWVARLGVYDHRAEVGEGRSPIPEGRESGTPKTELGGDTLAGEIPTELRERVLSGGRARQAQARGGPMSSYLVRPVTKTGPTGTPPYKNGRKDSSKSRRWVGAASTPTLRRPCGTALTWLPCGNPLPLEYVPPSGGW